MFKCDLCRERLAANEQPFCIEACPRKAMQIGRRDSIFKAAQSLADQYSGDLYGMHEHGGTSTIYVSKIPFSEIDEALVAQTQTGKAQTVRLNKPDNVLEKQRNWALLSLLSPLVGVIAALGFTGSKPAEKEHSS